MATRDRAVVRRLTPAPGQRLLAISDIHGNLPFLRGVLDKADYRREDLLVVVGDMLEKGRESLATLRYLMDLSRRGQVVCLRGNCDQIDLDFMDAKRWSDGQYWTVLRAWGERSTLLQMAAEAGIPVRGVEDLPGLRRGLESAFPEEWAFLRAMPHILLTPHLIFVHGGVPREEGLEELDAHRCMKNDNFLGQQVHFRRWCVVGHWPVTLYAPDIPCARPLIREDLRVISIDGGCVLKADGQLNCLIIPQDGSEEFTYRAYDGLPQATALDPQPPSRDSLNVRFGDCGVEVLRREACFSLCRHRRTGRTLWILNDYLRQRDGEVTCEDSTDYRLPVSPGDRLTVVRRTPWGTLAKKDGVTGWYRGRLTED